MTSTAQTFHDRVRDTITTRGLLGPGDRVVVAVSGGPDSTALLSALAALAPELDLDLHVAHFDHRLRPDSAEDALAARALAQRLDLPFTMGLWRGARPRTASPEEAARDARKRFLERVAADVGAARIATGHTVNDQAETVMMRLLQGTGRRGLGGIAPRRWWFVRPLIDCTRAEVEDYCEDLGLSPVRDPSNDDRSLLRNEIRHGVMPVLRESINAGIDDAVARFADLIRAEDAYLDERAADAVPALTDEHGETRLELAAFRAAHPALQRRALRLATWTHNGATFSADHTERLRTLALRGGTGDGLELPGGIRARVEYGVLVLGSHQAQDLPPAAVELVIPGEFELVGRDLRLASWITDRAPVTWPDGRWMCVLDADGIAFPLSVRAPEPGDRFRPLGMEGEKKVGDFFTDERVPRRRRPHVPVVVDADGAIVWIAGHRIDQRARVGERTTRHLWMSIVGGGRG